jgi:hypothetical protein
MANSEFEPHRKTRFKPHCDATGDVGLSRILSGSKLGVEPRPVDSYVSRKPTET